jgi:hypothetical protein
MEGLYSLYLAKSAKNIDKTREKIQPSLMVKNWQF